MGFYQELQELVHRTRDNPELFHRLVYEPETVLDQIGFLSLDAKRQILGLSPAELTAKLLGCEHGTGVQAECAAGTVCGCTEEETCGKSVCGCSDDTNICNDCATLCIRGSQACSDCTACSQCTASACIAAACTDQSCEQSCGEVSGCGAAGTCGETDDAVAFNVDRSPERPSTPDNFREFRL